MRDLNKNVCRAGATLLAAPVLLALAGAPAMAADDVQVSNTETIQAHLDADGRVRDARVYEQIAMQGTGTVELANPVSTKGLRNLDGFGAFQVKDGKMVSTETVNGEKRIRAVSDFDKQLPLTVSVSYKLDGKPVSAADVVGRSGLLETHYKVENVTGVDQELTFDDGTGATKTETQKVVIPMVGQLTTILPSSFTDVTSGEASMAGDGHGGTKMSFTMTLFGPIGSPTAEFGYSAHIQGGEIPPANISGLPVNPLESPSFKGGAASYKSGAASGVTLTQGATQIDANLLKLRDGAQTLLAGLIQLRDGAKTLNTGLVTQAVPGAAALSDGAGQLKDGTGQLATGAGTAKSGAAQLAAGAGQAKTGADKLDAGAAQLKGGLDQANAKAPALIGGLTQVRDGLTNLDAGLVQLYGGIGQLPAKAKPLHDGIGQLVNGIGSTTATGTLLNGVDQLRGKIAAAVAPNGALDQLIAGGSQAKGGVDQVKAGLDSAVAGLGDPAVAGQTARYGVAAVKKGLDDGLAVGGGIDQLAGGVAAAKATAGCLSDPVCQGTLAAVASGVTDLRSQTQSGSDGLGQVAGGLTQIHSGLSGQAIPGLVQISSGLGGQLVPGLTQLKGQLGDAVVGLVKVECGLSNASLKGVCDTARPGLLEGVGAVNAGVDQLVNGVVGQVQGAVGTEAQAKAADQKTLRGGTHALQGGMDQIAAGGQTLIQGLGQLGDGAGELKTGTGQLSGGLTQLSAGAGKLDTGLGTLADGANKLDSGAGLLRDGAGQLSTGLTSAADGSGQLATGLDTAATGAQQIPAGAQQLSTQGSTKLVDAGKQTASDYGLKYAALNAGADRAVTQSMAYGAPANAVGFTAYSLDIAGANDGGGTSVGQGAAAIALFGGAAGLAFWRRRTLV